jgi:lysophospholipase L1-like esterase
MADQIADQLDLHRPRLIVLMAGRDNDTSLAGSHVTRFMDRGDGEALRMRTLAALERLRLFQLARHAVLRLPARGHAEVADPAFAERHRDALARTWRADIETIVQAAQAHGARVLLMTYHIPPPPCSAREAVELAERLDVPLVRNDLAFDALRQQNRLARHLSPDGWHPASAGYALIARNAFQAIWRDDLLGLLPAAPPAPEAWPASRGRLALGTPDADPYLGTGWSGPEAGSAGRHRWTDGPRSELRLDLPGPQRRILRARVEAFLAPDVLMRQRVLVLVNGRPSARLWIAGPETRVHSVAIPEPECRGPALLTLLLPDARSPAAVGLSDDTRRLGLAFEWLGLEDFPEASPGSRLALGTAGAEAYLGAGWTVAVGGARWMQAPRAELLFRWNRDEPLTLRMKVHALRPRGLAGPPMTVDLNGQRLDPFRVRPTDALPAVYELRLPPSALEERNVLAFEWPGTLASFRELPGLRVESVEWDR